jgi:uncharacterized protein (UPF0147 family)
MKKTAAIVPVECIWRCILLIRNQKVILDRDLAVLYDVKTKALNQAVRRNIKRFPDDFIFQLTKAEKKQLVTNCDRFEPLKHSTSMPYAFTEQGIAMLSSVLNSERAINVNIAIMRTFVKLREILGSNDLLRRKIESMERKYDEKFEQVFAVLKNMLTEETRPRKQIGFHTEARGQKGQSKKGKGKR